MAKNEKVELGDVVKDRVTGFKGVVVGITRWLYGCDRAIVQPEGINKEGKTYENQSFDAPQLEVVTKKKVTAGDGTTGGYAPEPGKVSFKH